jgi:hypothetical protein
MHRLSGNQNQPHYKSPCGDSSIQHHPTSIAEAASITPPHYIPDGMTCYIGESRLATLLKSPRASSVRGRLSTDTAAEEVLSHQAGDGDETQNENSETGQTGHMQINGEEQQGKSTDRSNFVN